MIVLLILMYILLFLVSILLLFLVLPVFYAASGQKEDTTFLKASVSGPLRWFCFTFKMQDIAKRDICLKIFGINVNIEGKKKNGEKHKDIKNKEKKKRKKAKKREKGLLEKVLRAAQDFWRHTRPRHLEVEGRYGFEDPYYTGIACAVINCTAPHGEKYNVDLTPVFDDEVMEGKFVIEGRIVPAVLVWIFVKVFILPRMKARFHFTGKRRAA